jgi:hypothetical protein
MLLPRLSPLVFAGFGLERIRYSRIDILNSMLDWNILPVQKKIKAFAEQNINFSDTMII